MAAANTVLCTTRALSKAREETYAMTSSAKS